MDIVTLIVTVLPVLLTVLSSVFGVKYKKFKDWFKIARNIVEDVDEAIQDDNLTKQELKELSKRIKKVLK